MNKLFIIVSALLIVGSVMGASVFNVYPGNTIVYTYNVFSVAPGNWILIFQNGSRISFNSTANFSINVLPTASTSTTTTSTSTLSTTSTIELISSTTIPQNTIFTCVNGEHQQQVGNVLINCPIAVNSIINITPTNIAQTNTIMPISNITFTLNVGTDSNDICNINTILFASWNTSNSIDNSIGYCNIDIIVPQIRKLNLSVNVSSGQTIDNTLYGFNVIGKYVLVGANITLNCGQNWTYSTINAVIRSTSCDNVNSRSVSQSIQDYLNEYSAEGCAPGANVIFEDNSTNTPIDVCTRLANQSSSNIFTTMASYLSQIPNHNITQGLGQAWISSIEIANSTGASWHGQYLSCYNHFESPLNDSSAANELAACNVNEQAATIYPTLIVVIVAVLVLGLAGLFAYFNMQRKKERENKRYR